MTEKANENKTKTIYSPGSNNEYLFFEQSNGSQGENGYAVYYHMDNEVKFEPTFQNMDETKEYHPLEKVLWPLAKFPNEQCRIPSWIDTKAVFELVKEFVYENVELPCETDYNVVALWVMASYLPERFDSVPYFCIIGPRDSGKTRLLEVLWQLSFRTILSPSFSSSALFRTIDKYNPTLCLDEAEIYGNEQKTEAIAILNAGYRKGQYVLRVNMEKDGNCETFDCFGFKALASTNVFVSTLESRSIIINMRRNVRDIPLFIDMEKAANLRLLLLFFRFNILQDKETILNDKEQILSYLPKRHGRIAELFYPLIAVSPSEETRQEVREYARDVYGKRIEEEKASLEAEIVQVLLNCQNKVESGKLSVQAITDKVNEGKPERQQWNPRTVGRWVKKLGFRSTRIAGGSRAIFYDLSNLDYLAKRYILPTSVEPSLTSLMSLPTVCSHDGKSDVSEVSDGNTEVGTCLSINDLASIYWKEEFSKKQCGICGYEKETSWEAVTVKAQVIAVCEECVQAYQKEREVKP